MKFWNALYAIGKLGIMVPKLEIQDVIHGRTEEYIYADCEIKPVSPETEKGGIVAKNLAIHADYTLIVHDGGIYLGKYLLPLPGGYTTEAREAMNKQNEEFRKKLEADLRDEHNLITNYDLGDWVFKYESVGRLVSHIHWCKKILEEGIKPL